MASVARQIKLSWRHDNLSFEHHTAAARLDTPEERRDWLDKAEAGNWSVARLRKEIEDHQQADNPDHSVEGPGEGNDSDAAPLAAFKYAVIASKKARALYAPYNHAEQFLSHYSPAQLQELEECRRAVCEMWAGEISTITRPSTFH